MRGAQGELALKGSREHVKDCACNCTRGAAKDARAGEAQLASWWPRAIMVSQRHTEADAAVLNVMRPAVG